MAPVPRQFSLAAQHDGLVHYAGMSEAEPALPSPSLSTTRRLQSRPSMSATASMPIRKLAVALKATLEKLFGPTLHLSSATIEMTFPTAAERMHTTFFRSKITSWMAAQEEDYRQSPLARTWGRQSATSMSSLPALVRSPLHCWVMQQSDYEPTGP